MLTERLELIFQSASGNRVTLSLIDPKDNLTADQVRTAMQTIINKNVFTSAGGDLVGIIGARLVNREVTDLITG
ncbi:MAG: DUF2922 domain-containing protein [Firmicutes bacterium]|nr:DUF2922 domain-containing protein [Bacillota bacterium]